MEEIRKLKIKKAVLDTKARRSNMTCKVIECKLDLSNLSSDIQTSLHKMFLEAKWFYNAMLSSGDIPTFDTKVGEVEVKVKDKFETRQLDNLSSQMKQGIKTRVFNSLSTLKTLKENGFKIGKLKFKSQIDSIPLKQHNNTFTVLKNSKRIKIQGIKRPMRAYGLEQLPGNCEIANANLVRIGRDYYVKVTIFVPKEILNPPNQSVGIDFGCTTQLTLSTGEKIDFQVPVSSRVKKLDQELSRKTKGSKNRQKCLNQRQKAYLRTNNQRKDIKDKIVSKIVKNYGIVCFQDESIEDWKQNGHGKKIQFSAIGGIISALQRKAVTPVVVNKYYPSTQLCSQCNGRQKIGIQVRTYVCPTCGCSIDRDINAAKNIEVEGLKQLKILAERKESTPVEIQASFPNPVMDLGKAESAKQETQPSLVAG
jgi:putative transposase